MRSDGIKRALKIIVSLVLALGFGLYDLYVFRHVLWGKSLGFYMDTGLRMPQNARIVAEKDDYPGEAISSNLDVSNEGESLLVFDVKPADTAAYLARSPWSYMAWSKGPVPGAFLETTESVVAPYQGLFESSRVWYIAQPLARDNSFWDGQFVVIDPAKNRVYYVYWNH